MSFKEIVIKPAKKGYVVVIDSDDIRVVTSAHGMRELFWELEKEYALPSSKQPKKFKNKTKLS